MAYKKILVPLDGSEIAEKALPFVKSIAKLKNSNVILFAVSLTVFVDRRDRLFTSYLEVTAKELKQEGIKATTATSYGDVAREIVKYANNNKIDLIIMATHGYSRAKQWMFGSITQKVLYGTKIPVLLIKSKAPEVSVEFNRILLTLDGSPFSESTFPYVVGLAKNTNKEVLLLHICEPPIVPSYGSRPISRTWEKHRDDMWKEMEGLSTSYLKKTMAALKKKGIKKVKSRVIKAQSAEVAKTIMQISKEENIDLIIMAARGRSGVSSWVYGSIANKIVDEFSRPILLIRPETSIPSAPQNLLDDIWQGYIARKA